MDAMDGLPPPSPDANALSVVFSSPAIELINRPFNSYTGGESWEHVLDSQLRIQVPQTLRPYELLQPFCVSI